MATSISKEHAVGFLFTQNAGSATVTGFSDFNIDEVTFAAAYTYSPTFGALPGLYEFVGAYTTKDAQTFAFDERYIAGSPLEDIVAILPPGTTEGNYAFVFTGSQYLWVRDGAQRKRADPVNTRPPAATTSIPSGLGSPCGDFSRSGFLTDGFSEACTWSGSFMLVSWS